jgi:hypothetical protein
MKSRKINQKDVSVILQKKNTSVCTCIALCIRSPLSFILLKKTDHVNNSHFETATEYLAVK